MSVAPLAPITNRLLEGLPAAARIRFVRACEPFEFVFGQTLHVADEPIDHVYFPLSGFVSLLASLPGHAPLEVGMIGSEGMLGVTLILGIDEAPLLAIVQGEGTALRLSVAQFRRELLALPSLREQMNRYLFLLMTQLSKTLACTYFHEVEPRLARWLLMTHDRAHSEHLHLTHQFLADMLGVQRSAITIAAGLLQKRKLIRYVRGDIKVQDRAGLEAAACGCYDQLNDDYGRMIDPKPTPEPEPIN